MHKDERDALEVLKFELKFLDSGGYEAQPGESWRPQFIFEDSPTCLNYACQGECANCADCILMPWIPPENRDDKIPCRSIPLNPAGETLDSLYRWSGQEETEKAVHDWLCATIQQLEEERKRYRLDPSKSTSLAGHASPGTPLCQKLHPKCANPACTTAFHWRAGGKFFRFRSSEAAQNCGSAEAHPQANLHDVKHFWLCEPCSHIFTLVYADGTGVILKLLWRDESIAKVQKGLAVENTHCFF
jgi:hypothetical protein